MRSQGARLYRLAWSVPIYAALAAGCSELSSRSASTPAAGATAATAASGDAAPTSDPKLVSRYDDLADQILDTRKKEVEVVRNILQKTYGDAEAALARAREALKTPNSPAAKPAVENLAMLVGYLATEGDASVSRVRKRLIEGGHHFNPMTPAGTAPGAHGHQAPGPQGGQAGHHAGGQPGASAPAEAPKAGAPPAAGTPGHAAPGATAPAQPGQTPPGHAAPGHAPGQAPPAGHHAAGQPPAGGDQGAHHHAGPQAHHQSEAGHHQGNVPLIGYDPGYVVVSRAAKKTLLDASHSIARLAAAPAPAALEAAWKTVESTCVSLGIAKK